MAVAWKIAVTLCVAIQIIGSWANPNPGYASGWGYSSGGKGTFVSSTGWLPGPLPAFKKMPVDPGMDSFISDLLTYETSVAPGGWGQGGYASGWAPVKVVTKTKKVKHIPVVDVDLSLKDAAKAALAVYRAKKTVRKLVRNVALAKAVGGAVGGYAGYRVVRGGLRLAGRAVRTAAVGAVATGVVGGVVATKVVLPKLLPNRLLTTVAVANTIGHGLGWGWWGRR